MARKPIAPAFVELLLLVRPLIEQARGEKREALLRAWLNVFNHGTTEMLGLEDGGLPTGRRGIIVAMLRLSMQMAKADGLSGMDLLEEFNRAADSGALIGGFDADKAVERGFALLGTLAALQLDAAATERQEIA